MRTAPEPREAGLALVCPAGEGHPRSRGGWGRKCPPEPRPWSPRANPKASTFRLHPLLSRYPPEAPPRRKGRQAASGAVSSDISLSLNAGSPSSDMQGYPTTFQHRVAEVHLWNVLVSAGKFCGGDWTLFQKALLGADEGWRFPARQQRAT